MKANSGLLTLILAGIVNGSSMAGTMGTITEPSSGGWIAQLSLGADWAKAGKTQAFYLAQDIEKAYVVHKKSNSLVNSEFFIGKQKRLSSLIDGQFGIAIGTTGSANVNGVIWDDADPRFDNYLFHYKVRNTRIMAKGIAILNNQWIVAPFVSASIGVAFNRAYKYENIPTIFEAERNPNFVNKTKSSFNYTLAIGVQKALYPNWQAGVRYEFADWGKSELGRALGQTQNSGLRLSHLYTNGIMFHLTYKA